MVLTDAGKEGVARLTKEHVGERVAILHHGKVVAAPVIREEISGGELVVSGISEDTGRQIAGEVSEGNRPNPAMETDAK